MTKDDARYPSLRDRVAFVTGGASSIGTAVVFHLAAQGRRGVRRYRRCGCWCPVHKADRRGASQTVLSTLR